MKQRFHDALLGIVGLAGVAFFALSGASCEAAKMQCAVGHGPFAVVYEVTSGDAACYEAANRRYAGACAQYGLASDDFPDCAGLSQVEHVAFSTYLGVVGRTERPVKYKDEDGNEYSYTIVEADGADYNTRKIAFQSSVMGGLHQERDGVGNDANDKPYAFGDYTSFPDADNFCYAGGGSAPLSVADMNIDAVDMEPAVHFRQEWSDVTFYVTTGVPGTQVAGTMKFNNDTDGCEVTYKFTGLYPAVFCGIPIEGYVAADGSLVDGHEDNDSDPATDAKNDTDDDGDPATAVDNDTDDDGDPMTPVTNDKDDDGNPLTPVDNDDDDPTQPDVDVDEDSLIVIRFDPDDLACDPRADPASGRVFGSGINPDFQTYCHPDYLHCILKEGTGLVR